MSFPQAITNPSAISLSAVTTNTWTTLASGAPAGTKGMVMLLSTGGATFVRETRSTSSSDNYVSDTCASGFQTYRFVPIDSSGNFQYYTSNTTPTNDAIYPIVWLGPEWTFLTNIQAMSSTLTTSYATYSTGGFAPGALCAVFNIHGGADLQSYFGAPTASTTFSNGNSNSGREDFLAMLNGSQQYGAVGPAGRQPYLVCYCTTGFTGYLNPISVTIGTAGSYQNIPQGTDTGAIWQAYFLNPTSGGPFAFQIAQQGSSWTAPNQDPAQKFSGLCAVATPGKINIASLNLGVNEIGYFTSGTIFQPFTQTQFFVTDTFVQQ